ncbi:MAG: hypothetical protein R3E68_16545 [Burkholderiaceae bacterium]
MIAAGTSADKLTLLRERGSNTCLELNGGFRDQVMQITGGRESTSVFDPVGAMSLTSRCG